MRSQKLIHLRLFFRVLNIDDCVGIGQDQTVMLNLRQESRKPISLETLFEVVADDLQRLNDNLLSVSTSPPFLFWSLDRGLCFLCKFSSFIDCWCRKSGFDICC